MRIGDLLTQLDAISKMPRLSEYHQRVVAQAAQLLSRTVQGESEMSMTSLVNEQGQPFVQLVWGEHVAQFDPAAARAHALAILETTEAAANDAFIYKWGTSEAGLGKNEVMTLLYSFRQWRKENKV